MVNTKKLTINRNGLVMQVLTCLLHLLDFQCYRQHPRSGS